MYILYSKSCFVALDISRYLILIAMQKIKTLPKEVINQIAAGEVVERPAHLVKELVENSIDAGATEIEIEFSQGGRFVRVKDDGCGMSAMDMEKCIERHATSKIIESNDLWSLNSFGFRGEALSSISSVSKVTIQSKEPSSSGSSLQISHGLKSEVHKSSLSQGTQITVEELFKNTPARLKFLKSEAAEHTQIKNIVKGIAMAHFNISFKVICKNELLYVWKAVTNAKDRVLDVLNQKSLYVGEGEAEGYKAKVVISDPKNTFKTSRELWFYVHGRLVKDRGLQAAVMGAYRSLLMHGEFPLAVVYLEPPVGEVDVNIHPTKSQVKFQNSSNAFRAVHRAVRGVLEKAPWLEDVLSTEGPALQRQFAAAPVKKEVENHAPLQMSKSFSDEAFSKTQYKQKTIDMTASATPNIQNWVKADNELSTSMVVKANQSQVNKWSSLQVIGQVDLTYIMAQSDEAILFIDQHAAHERVAYETLVEHWSNGSIDVQNFLVPLIVEVSEEGAQAIEDQKQEWEKLGVFLERLGVNSIAINAAPQLLKERALKAVIKETAEELSASGGSYSLETKVRDICATLACHSVVRAGHSLSISEMESLLKDMDKFPLSSFCPHGRPVYIKQKFTQLEKEFGRI